MLIGDFDVMVLNNAEFLRPFAITLTKDTETARDLFQETLYKALANKEKYNVGTNIKGWLFTIMRNIFINNYRRRSKQKVIPGVMLGSSISNKNQEITVNEEIGMLNIKAVYKVIYDLPGIFKNPFLMYIEGYKYHEIAGMLGEPLGTIKSRIHFARKLLKTSIDRY